jgi:hypothetical protein
LRCGGASDGTVLALGGQVGGSTAAAVADWDGVKAVATLSFLGKTRAFDATALVQSKAARDCAEAAVRVVPEEAAAREAAAAVSLLGDPTSLLGDAKSLLGDAKSSLGDAESLLGDAKSSLGDAKR